MQNYSLESEIKEEYEYMWRVFENNEQRIIFESKGLEVTGE